MDWDPYSPPGSLTAHGECISISAEGDLYAQRGSHVAQVYLAPLQWQLLSVAFSAPSPKITLELEIGQVCLRKERLGMSLEIKDRTQTVQVLLRQSEADDFKEAAGARAPLPTTNQETA